MKEIILNLKIINYEKLYHYSIVLFAFILPLSRAGISFFIIFLPLIYLLEKDFKRKYHQILSNKVLMALVIFIIYSSLSIFWSSNLEMALHIIRLDTYFLVTFVISTSLKREYIPHVITAFLMGMFISETIAYGVFFELWQFKHAIPENPSPLMIYIDYSIFMALTAILLLNKIVSKHYLLKEKIILSLFFLSVTGNLFLTPGRTGQGAFVIAIIVYVYYILEFLLNLFL